MSSIGGAKAQAFGSMFEELFHSQAVRNGLSVTRFPDGCKRAKGNKLVPVKTPFDWIVSQLGKGFALLDTKTSATDCFKHSLITQHQVTEMLMHARNGIVAGYVIYLREIDRVIFVDSLTLLDLSLKRGSISVSQGLLLGDSSRFDVRHIFR